MSNKFDDENIKQIDLMKLDINDVEALMTAKYEVEFKDTMYCIDCKHIFNVNDIRFEEDNRCPYCHSKNFTNCCQDDLDYDTYKTHINNVLDIEDDVGKEIVDKIIEIMKKEEGVVKVEENKKINLQEATIKALYDGLKDDTEVEDVEGLIDDVLVVTDPEITTDEYNEVIERAEEIVEETPEGDIPLDPTYLGEYLQTCPICGASFVEDHILEPGTACPVCYETPEAFVMVGKLQAEEEVAEDNGLVDDGTTEPQLDTEKVPLEDLGSEETDIGGEEIEPEETPTEEPTEEPTEPTEPNRPRGARLRRNREVASKEMPKGNILTESLEIIQQKAGSKNDKLNKYLVKDTSKNMECWFRAMVDNQGILFYEPIKDDKSLNGPIGTRPFDYFTELTNSHRTELDKLFKDILDNSEGKDLKKEATNDKDDKDDKELLLGDEQNDELDQNDKKFQLVEADEEQIEDLKNNSALTWEGMAIDDDNLQAIVDDLKQETRIKLPVIFYTWKGKLFNEMYGLTENNAYPDDLNFLAIDLDNWENIGKLPVYKFQIGARWLDDIVDNNKLRQDEIDGSEPHLWE